MNEQYAYAAAERNIEMIYRDHRKAPGFSHGDIR
jgi:hypothetical protein